jgi:hypothetical protein
LQSRLASLIIDVITGQLNAISFCAHYTTINLNFMKKFTYLSAIASFFMIAVVVQSCKKDDDSAEEKVTDPVQFIADNSTFSDFETWTLRASIHGADPAVGTLHGGNDTSVTRDVYVKNDQQPVNGIYPQGTLIVKHSYNTSGTLDEYTAMAKRGGNFNASHNGWEWFVLNQDGSINTNSSGAALRGEEIVSLGCRSCHAFGQKDYTYTTP